MFINQILVGIVAFIVSFVLGLWTNSDQALLIGVITGAATGAGAVIADKRRIVQEKLNRNSLRNQVRELEGQQTQLSQYISAATATKQEIGARLNGLQSEQNQLLGRVSGLNQQKEEVNQELAIAHRQLQELKGESNSLQTQVHLLLEQQTELDQTLEVKTSEVEAIETQKTSLQAEVSELSAQIEEQRRQQEGFNQDVSALK
ncbi:MAG TPA: hypothetical protein V6D48_13135, partial [Oculatellaceae cyanobacterium]